MSVHFWFFCSFSGKKKRATDRQISSSKRFIFLFNFQKAHFFAYKWFYSLFWVHKWLCSLISFYVIIMGWQKNSLICHFYTSDYNHFFIETSEKNHLFSCPGVSLPAGCEARSKLDSNQAWQLNSRLSAALSTRPSDSPSVGFYCRTGIVLRWTGFCPTWGNCGACLVFIFELVKILLWCQFLISKKKRSNFHYPSTHFTQFCLHSDKFYDAIVIMQLISKSQLFLSKSSS